MCYDLVLVPVPLDMKSIAICRTGRSRRRRPRAAIAVVLFVSSCVSSKTVVCEDGGVCAAGMRCARVDGAFLCVSPDQLTQCEGLAEAASCGDEGRCYDGVCFPAGCGNARLDPDEACDDGNNGAGDGCSADCKSNETCGNGIVDPVSGEECDDGPIGAAASHDGCASQCRSEIANWKIIPQLAIDPVARVTYDARRGRVVLVGESGGQLRTWELDGSTFTLRAPAASPGRRRRSAIAYDAARERVVLFGGSTFDDTWEWNGTTWTSRTPTTTPPGRANHVMVYDAQHERVIVFGGDTSLGVRLGDTWAWDGMDWSPIVSTEAPSARTGMAMAYDPARGVVVLFGGQDATGLVDDTWELAGTTWTRKSVDPALARDDSGMAYDPGSRQIIMHGGHVDSVPQNDTWSWNGIAWTAHPSAGGPAAGTPIMTTVAREGHVLLVQAGATYRWAAGSWTGIGASDEVLLMPRSAHAAAIDPLTRQMVVHGGNTGQLTTDTTLLWNGVWSRYVGAGPGAISSARLVHDATRRHFMLFGGVGSVVLDETWVFDDTGWSLRAPLQSPPARHGHVMVYDVARERTVLFGGRSGSTSHDDTWLWDGTTWTLATPATAPAPRFRASATYDPIRGVVVVFGGQAEYPTVFRDTWEWDGTTWTQRAITGPPARSDAAIAWDPARRRAVLFGGFGGGEALDDQWEWDGSSWEQVQVSATLRRRSGHVMVSAPDGAGVLMMGGSDAAVTYDELARLRWDGSAPGEACTGIDDDGDGRDRCGSSGDPDCQYICRPLCPTGGMHAATCGPTSIGCGDTICHPAGETCLTCPEDCGTCPSTCGDFTCDANTETATTCPGDC